MKLLSRMFNNLPKRVGAAAIVALAFALPALSFAADTVTLEGAMGVANVTAGDTQYGPSVNAKYDQVVKYQVYYHNKENPDSGKVAQNVTVKIALPSAPGKTQKATATVKGDNTNTITSDATVNLDRGDAYLQYIPGSAVWRHNTGDNTNVNYVDTKISDDVVTSGAGLRLEDEKPCYNFSATVTVLARVIVPGVKVKKEVQIHGQNDKWAQSNTAQPGDTLDYMITYENAGNSQQDTVVIRDSLPLNMALVPGTTKVYNSNYPNGQLVTSNNITAGGITIGSYTPGASAYITFQAKLPAADKLECGTTTFNNVGVARPQGMQEYYDTATTKVEKKCETPPSSPKYSCDLLEITKGDNRTVTVSKFTTSQSNGATFKNVVLDWGDQSTALTTTEAVGKNHQYAKDGTYTVTATAHFTVNGKDVSNTTANCAKSVSFTSTPTTPETPATPEAPQELANTGPGQVAGLFAAVAAAGALAHRLFLARRLGRE
jgi:uncharacterized repeat protein (TIGR01451 family)